MAPARAAPPETGSEPPAQKSFCTSTMINARTRSTISPSAAAMERCLFADSSGNPPAMVIRRIARPLLSVAFIGQGVESLLNPKTAAEAAAPAVDGLHTLPDPVGSKIPSDPHTFAHIN